MEFAQNQWRALYRAATPILLVFVGAFALLAQDKPSTPDFSRYKQTESFQYYLTFQLNATGNLAQSNLLAISAFLEGGAVLQYRVRESGDNFSVREVYDWAHQASHRSQLSESAMKSLRSEIGKLPSVNMSPPIDRLVIVSFKQGTNWITRSYDGQSLPEAMTNIYAIIGERFETRDKKPH